MSSTHQSKFTSRAPELSLGAFDWPESIALRQRLQELHRRQPPDDPAAAPIRIGIEDPYGDLAHVVETTRLTEAVRVFEILADFGLVPGHGRCRATDGRTLMCTYRQPARQIPVALPGAPRAAQAASGPEAAAPVL